MKYLLLHTVGWDPSPWDDAFLIEGVERRVVATPAEVRSDERPTVLVIDPAAREAWLTTYAALKLAVESALRAWLEEHYPVTTSPR